MPLQLAQAVGQQRGTQLSPTQRLAHAQLRDVRGIAAHSRAQYHAFHLSRCHPPQHPRVRRVEDAAPWEVHYVVQKTLRARHGPVLVVDVGVRVPQVGLLDQLRRRQVRFRLPAIDSKAAGGRRRLSRPAIHGHIPQHEAARKRPKALLQERAVHTQVGKQQQLRLDAVDARRSLQGLDQVIQQHLAHGIARAFALAERVHIPHHGLGGLTHAKRIARDPALPHGHIPGQRPAVHVVQQQLDGTRVVPAQPSLPFRRLFLQQGPQGRRGKMAEIQNFELRGRCQHGRLRCVMRRVSRASQGPILPHGAGSCTPTDPAWGKRTVADRAVPPSIARDPQPRASAPPTHAPLQGRRPAGTA